MKRLLPLIILIVFIGGGAGAGFFLRPVPEIVPEEKKDGAEKVVEEKAPDDTVGFVKLNNQFVIPIVKNDVVAALVVLSISLETGADQTEGLYQKEPKIRDAFLRVLFDHAYGGGFDGAFTTSPSLDALRHALLEAAHSQIGPEIRDILITDIVRQDT